MKAETAGPKAPCTRRKVALGTACERSAVLLKAARLERFRGHRGDGERRILQEGFLARPR
ncbi:MAG: hypothetical protein WDN24_12675 [Sphingomonas sp.]